MAKTKGNTMAEALAETETAVVERRMRAHGCTDGHFGPAETALVQVLGGYAEVPASLVPYFEARGWTLTE